MLYFHPLNDHSSTRRGQFPQLPLLIGVLRLQSDKPTESENVQGTEAAAAANSDDAAPETTTEPCTPADESAGPDGPSEPQMPDPTALVAMAAMHRSEERRVGKEC